MTDARAATIYDLLYYISKAMRQQPQADYYALGAQHGEEPGQWTGSGALALGFADGEEVKLDPYMAVYNMIDPRTGERMPGRGPKGAQRFLAELGKLLDAEPEATAERARELERIAAQKFRRPKFGTDATIGHFKSISIVHASLRENIRQARLAGDKDAEHLWATRERAWTEALQRANHAGVQWLEKHAGVTRVGAVLGKVRDREAGRWVPAHLVVTSWMQGTNRDGEMHDHEHNAIARAGLCDDGIWRSVDTMAIRHHLGGFGAVVDVLTRASLTREFGVRWVQRGDDFGFEIGGVSRELIERFSTRTTRVTDALAELSREFEKEYGRKPNSREVLFLSNEATMVSRKAKEDGKIDWDALAARWNTTMQGELGDLVNVACDFSGSEITSAPDEKIQASTIRVAIAKVQQKHSNWNRSQLMDELANTMGQEYMTMDPDSIVLMLESLADRAINTMAYNVVCQEAPQWPPLPASLVRESDSRSVFTRPGTMRFTTRGQLAMEERMLQQAQRLGAPALTREFAAACLGTTVEQVEPVLTEPANDASAITATGLRMDQAAAAWWALTSGMRAAVICGPAGSGKTATAAQVTRAWERNGGRVIGLTTAQGARDVLAKAGVRTAFNTSQFEVLLRKKEITIQQGDLLLIDEASMAPMSDLAKIINLAERNGAKVLAIGDHEQLGAVEQGGGFRLLANHLGFTQLAVPVRFEEEWERAASLKFRMGNKTALDDLAEHGRITGGEREWAMARARRAYVANWLAGEHTILMAWTREDCRTLSRMIRDDLIHLQQVHDGPEVGIAEHGRASAGDLIVYTDNDHKFITDYAEGDPHELTNGDVFRIESIVAPAPLINEPGGAVVRRQIGIGRETRQPVYASETTFLPSWRLQDNAELAYAVTGHKSQGATVARGLAFITGGESLNWAYVAMTRGFKENSAIVVTHDGVVEQPHPLDGQSELHAVPVRAADLDPATRPDPGLERYDRMQRERNVLPEPEQTPIDARVAIGVLSDVMDHQDAEESATEYRMHALSDADHSSLLGSQFDNLAGRAQREYHEQLLLGAVPPEHHDDMQEVMTWLSRTLRSAEAAGQDPAQVVRAAVGARPLTGSRHVGKVVYARMRNLVDPMVPLEPRPFSERVPAGMDPAEHEYVTEVAVMLDQRKVRIGEHQAEHPEPWALNALGVVPDDPVARLNWQERAGKIGYYRERYFHDDQADVIGEQPPVESPEQRQDWFSAFAAQANTGKLDLSTVPDKTLRRMVQGYATATSWAPPNVSKVLADLRRGKEVMRIEHERALAEAEVATDQTIKARQETIASKALSLYNRHGEREQLLRGVADDRREWDAITKGSRALAVQAHRELHTRHPQAKVSPLKSAEPAVPDDALATPNWLVGLTEQRAQFRGQYDLHRGLKVPALDPEQYQAEEEAFPVHQPQREAVLQPAQHEIGAAERVAQPQAQAQPELQP